MRARGKDIAGGWGLAKAESHGMVPSTRIGGGAGVKFSKRVKSSGPPCRK